MVVAIYSRPNKTNASKEIFHLINRLVELNIAVVIHQTFCDYLQETKTLPPSVATFVTYEDIKDDVTFLISIGGDGTLLEKITLVRDSEIPVLGINTGRLGFLANVSIDEIENAIQALVHKKYTVDSRTLLRLETNLKLFGEANFALNEINVHARESSVMMTIHTYINGEYLNTYWSDGLIISTPTGSTAYSLSCGGPIVIPDSKSFIITPIAPHNLNARPLIISDNDVVSLKVEGRSKSFRVSLDSRSARIEAGTELTIRKERFTINLIRLAEHNFIQTLRNKLSWGIDKRN